LDHLRGAPVKLVAQALLAAATPVGAENVLTGLNCSELHRRDLINQTNQQLETAGHGTCPSSGIRQGDVPRGTVTALAVEHVGVTG
jgi:hypothetical protein